MEPTFTRIVKTEKQDLQALFMILSPEGVDVSFQCLLLEEPKSYFLF